MIENVGRSRQVRLSSWKYRWRNAGDYIEDHYSGPVQWARLEKGRNTDIRERRTMDD